MKSYLRFLSRNKLYTAIMAVGLSVSLAFVIIMSCYVWQNLSVNRYYPDSDKIYAVGTPEDCSVSSFRWGSAIVDNFPEAEKSVTVLNRYGKWTVGDVKVKKTSFMGIDPEFFDMFPVKVIHGDLEGFNDYSNAIITKSLADRLGGDKSIGKVIYDERDKYKYTICAVIEGFQDTFFANEEVILNTRAPEFEKTRNEDFIVATGGTITFVKIKEGTDIEELTTKLDQMYESNLPKISRHGKKHFSLTRVDKLYFSDKNGGKIGLKKGNKGLLTAFSIIAVFLMISSIFNYINLSTALGGKRCKEMATRMLLGETRREIFATTITESVSFTAICMAIAFLVAYMCLPAVNGLINSPVPIKIKFSLVYICMYLLILGITAVVCGLIPSLLSFRFKPIEIIKGGFRYRTKRTFSKIFIIVQNGIAVIIIAGAIVMGCQIRHMMNMPLGAQTEGIYLVDNVSDNIGKILSEIPYIGKTGRVVGRPGKAYMTGSTPGEPKDFVLQVIRCDTVAFDLWDFKIVEDYGTRTGGWLTESAFNLYKESHAFVDIIKWFECDIAGVIEDVSFTNAMDLIPDAVGMVLCRKENNADYIVELTDPTEENIKELDRIFREETIRAKGPDETFSSGYLPDIIEKEYIDMKKQFSMVILFMSIAIMLSAIGQIAMSTYYATEKEKEIGIRKVFGGTVRSESIRNIFEYMVYCIIACIVAVPISVWIAGRYLETFAYKMPMMPWIFIVSVLAVFAISLLSVLWQTLRAACTNPADALRKE